MIFTCRIAEKMYNVTHVLFQTRHRDDFGGVPLQKERTTMYEHVILAADGSEACKEAIKEVNRLIQHGCIKKLTILNAVNNLAESINADGTGIMMSPTMTTELYELNKLVGTKVVSATRQMIEGDIEIDEKVLFGNPPDVICDAAVSENADLIVMGSRGQNPLKGLLLGSASMRVLQCAHCAILIAKVPEHHK